MLLSVMKNELQELIDAYRAKASELIPLLSEALGFKLPITNTEWVGLDIPHRGQTSDGLKYFKHGYGVAIKFDGGEIDIDFGDKASMTVLMVGGSSVLQRQAISELLTRTFTKWKQISKMPWQKDSFVIQDIYSTI